MQNKLGAVFGQTQEPPPKIHWVDDTKEGGL
jgi:hypothetical protein